VLHRLLTGAAADREHANGGFAAVRTCAARGGLALLVAGVLAGCASDPEDRVFFDRGWFRPEAAANERMAEHKY